MTLSTIAQGIWNNLGPNDRANGATTIAVFALHSTDHDGPFRFCTSNDVSAISQAAKNEADNGHNTFSLDGNEISQAGAGFHAEMWGIILAGHLQSAVDGHLNQQQALGHYNALAPSAVFASVGASRACCKQCSAVLQVLGIAAEQPSQTEYPSWYNPLTVDEHCMPRPDFATHQRRTIPDFRNHGNSYWFTDATGRNYVQQPRGQ